MIKALQDKIALVTGASGGIGSAIALRLAKEGASIIVHYNSDKAGAEAVAKKIKDMGGKAETIFADFKKNDFLLQIISHIDKAFNKIYVGRLDILVNSAGMLNFNTISDATDEQFDDVFNVNVRSVFQLSREASKRMKKTKWGRIINIGSVFGEATPAEGLSIYCASKFAIQGFTRAWSRDLGKFGITVNNIQPALIQTEPFPTEGPAYDAMKKYVSVNRFGTSDEVANAAAFLSQPDSGFINGASINVDGGWSA
jgi:3-oxoacyl-[acyl-carrier protein] reductase